MVSTTISALKVRYELRITGEVPRTSASTSRSTSPCIVSFYPKRSVTSTSEHCLPSSSFFKSFSAAGLFPGRHRPIHSNQGGLIQLQEELGVNHFRRTKLVRQQGVAYLTQVKASSGKTDVDVAEVEDSKSDKVLLSKKLKTVKKVIEKGKSKGKNKRVTVGGLLKVCALSEELAALLGAKEMPRVEIIKAVWSYIKENSLQDPSNKRLIICNDELKKLLKTDRTDMFQLNKILAAHIKPIPGPDGKLPTARNAKPKGSQRGFSVPSELSPALIKFLGLNESSLPRSEVVKQMWTYIKEKGLQDPSNRKYILCDGPLKELLQTDTFSGFGILKLLSPHFIKKNS